MIYFKFAKTLYFPVNMFFGTITKVKNYKNFLPWCLDSYEKNHKSFDLTLKEINTKYPELIKNELINNYLLSKLNEEKSGDIKNEENLKEEMKFNIKTFEGFIKVGFDIIDFSYISKVYTISNDIVLSITDDSQSHIFSKLESLWIIKENEENFYINLNNQNCHINCLKETHKINSLDKKGLSSLHLGKSKEKPEINVEYSIQFEMKSFIFNNISSVCMSFLGENIVKSFINQTEKMFIEETLKNKNLNNENANFNENIEEKLNIMLNLKLNDILLDYREKYYQNEFTNLEKLLKFLYSVKKLEYREIEILLDKSKLNINVLYNLLHFSDILNINHEDQINFITNELKYLLK